MKTAYFFTAAMLAVSLPAVAQDADPEIMNIAGKSIPKSEFEYVYNKNLRQQEVKTPVDEYVTLFCNYKLKVAEAEAEGLDTTQTFQNEYKGYRSQLVAPYMIEPGVEERLAREAYARLLEEVEASHILFSIPPTATTSQKKAIYARAMRVREQALNGTDFGTLARRYSDDPSAEMNEGYLGYFKGFQMVYPFEKAAYETPTGEISLPVESRFGYHLIKVTGRRKTRAIGLAHIMLRVSQDAPEKEQKAKEKLIKDIYKQIEKGADFADLARQYSEDASSAVRGGELPVLESGQFVKSFEDAAFALDSIGQVSYPVRTEFGWHILKLLSEKTPNSYDMLHDAIVHRMARDERANAGRKQYMEKLKEQKGFSWNAAVIDQLEAICADTAFYAKLSEISQPLFVFDGKEYPASGLTTYFVQDETPTVNALRDVAEAYATEVITDYQVARLDENNTEFHYLLQEYRDGMLLFEISNREVWEKAMNDTKGLEKYFKKNKNKYAWKEPHYKGFVISSDDEAIAAGAKRQLDKKSSLPADSLIRRIYAQYNDSINHVSIETILCRQGENRTVDYLVYGVGEPDTTAKLSVKAVSGKLLKKPESYEDVKGLAVADYQNYLEQNWIASLRKKYPIVIHRDVLATIKTEE